MTDNGPKLGRTVRGTGRRDAIHIAVAPVKATVRLRPGVRVGLNEDGEAELSSTDQCVGIVDPFLTDHVEPGQTFWLLLYPGTVTSLRHHWAHPAFPESEPQSMNPTEAERWLRELAREVGQDYDSLVTAGHDVAREGFASVYGGESFRDALYDDGKREAFWLAWSAVTGEPTPQAGRDGNTFSCHC